MEPASCAKSETCHTLRGTRLSPVGGSFTAASMIAPTLGRKGLGLDMPTPGGRQNLAPSWSTRRLSSACARMVPQAAIRRSALYNAAHTRFTSLVDRCHSALARCRSLSLISCDRLRQAVGSSYTQLTSTAVLRGATSFSSHATIDALQLRQGSNDFESGVWQPSDSVSADGEV